MEAAFRLDLRSGTGAVGWAWWADRRYKSAREEIESEIVAGRHAIACRGLNNLLSWRADPNGEIAYLLGASELARGRYQAAGEAWARIAPGPRSRNERSRVGCICSRNPDDSLPPSG